MVFGILFIAEIALLFILSRLLTRSFSYILLYVTRSQSFAIHSLAFLFLPGTIVHELAHAIMASVLFVPIGHMDFFPRLQGDHVKLGSVAIAKTDPLRRFVIGVAPILVGLLVIFAAFFYFAPFLSEFFNWQTILLFYIVFEIGNTMFSSRKDMEGAIGLLIVVLLIALVLFFLGVRISTNLIANLFTPQITQILEQLDKMVLVAIGIDMLLVLGVKALKK